MSALSQRERMLAERRQALLARSYALRMQIGSAMVGLQPRLEDADRVLQAGRWLRRRAVWVGVAATALLWFKRPRGLLRLATRGWGIWRALRVLIP